jgi:hypothetical protein
MKLSVQAMPRQTKPEPFDDVHHDAPAVQVPTQPSHLSQEVLVLHATPVFGVPFGPDGLLRQVLGIVVLRPERPPALSTSQCRVAEEQLRCQHLMTSRNGSQLSHKTQRTRQETR